LEASIDPSGRISLEAVAPSSSLPRRPPTSFRSPTFAVYALRAWLQSPGGSLNCGSAELGLVLAMAINNWQPAPLWVLLLPIVVVRISFVSHRRPFMDFGKMLNEKLRSCLNLMGTSNCWWRHEKRRNRDAMFSNCIYISYCHMAENQPRIKRTVLFVNLSLFFSPL
jgi:hypothetical protein